MAGAYQQMQRVWFPLENSPSAMSAIAEERYVLQTKTHHTHPSTRHAHPHIYPIYLSIVHTPRLYQGYEIGTRPPPRRQGTRPCVGRLALPCLTSPRLASFRFLSLATAAAVNRLGRRTTRRKDGSLADAIAEHCIQMCMGGGRRVVDGMPES